MEQIFIQESQEGQEIYDNFKAIETKENSIKIGDVFETSWGYDQTNYNFIIVVGISPSGKTAICQLAKIEDVGNTAQCNIQKPVAEGYGYKFRMKIEDNKTFNEVCLRGSYPFCSSQVARIEESKSDEKPSMRLDTFSKVKENEVFYETDSRFGH